MQEATNSDPMDGESSERSCTLQNAFVSGWPKKAFRWTAKQVGRVDGFLRNQDQEKKRSFSLLYNVVGQVYLKDK
jgi:hypothetical protein